MLTNEDLAAVRDMRVDVAEPSDIQVSRVRHRILSTLDGPESRPRSRRWMLAAVGAAAATVLAVGVAVVAQPRPGTGPTMPGPQLPGGQPAATGGVVLPIDMSVTPVVVPAGAYLYVRHSSDAYLHEMWVEVDGGIVVSIVRTDAGREAETFVEPSRDRAAIAADRAQALAAGPSLAHPTPAFLNTLPTDAHVLLEMISDQIGRTGGGQPRDDLIFKGSLEFLGTFDPLLSPAVRAAFLEALALAPGATVDHSPRTFAGHDVYLVQQTTDMGTITLIVDSGSGRVIGDAAGEPTDPLRWAEEVTFAVVTQPGTRP
jgi:hypothetical protein